MWIVIGIQLFVSLTWNDMKEVKEATGTVQKRARDFRNSMASGWKWFDVLYAVVRCNGRILQNSALTYIDTDERDAEISVTWLLTCMICSLSSALSLVVVDKWNSNKDWKAAGLLCWKTKKLFRTTVKKTTVIVQEKCKWKGNHGEKPESL